MSKKRAKAHVIIPLRKYKRLKRNFPEITVRRAVGLEPGDQISLLDRLEELRQAEATLQGAVREVPVWCPVCCDVRPMKVVRQQRIGPCPECGLDGTDKTPDEEPLRPLDLLKKQAALGRLVAQMPENSTLCRHPGAEGKVWDANGLEGWTLKCATPEEALSMLERNPPYLFEQREPLHADEEKPSAPCPEPGLANADIPLRPETRLTDADKTPDKSTEEYPAHCRMCNGLRWMKVARRSAITPCPKCCSAEHAKWLVDDLHKGSPE